MAKTITMVVLAAAAFLASDQVALAGSPAVRAVIWPNFVVTISPKTVKHGTVVFKIKNRDGMRSHRFSIDGVVSPSVKPDTTAVMRVTFKKQGLYFFTLGDPNPASQMQPGTNQTTGGVLRVD